MDEVGRRGNPSPFQVMLAFLHMFRVYPLDPFFHKSSSSTSNLQKNIGPMLWFLRFS